MQSASDVLQPAAQESLQGRGPRKSTDEDDGLKMGQMLAGATGWGGGGGDKP